MRAIGGAGPRKHGAWRAEGRGPRTGPHGRAELAQGKRRGHGQGDTAVFTVAEMGSVSRIARRKLEEELQDGLPGSRRGTRGWISHPRGEKEQSHSPFLTAAPTEPGAGAGKSLLPGFPGD